MKKTNQQKPLDCGTATIEQLKKAFYNHEPISGIEVSLYHCSAHPNEAFPDWILRTTPEGQALFPGLGAAACGSISTTKLREAEYMGEEGFFKTLNERYLLIGVGGGPFDEHDDRGKKISCTHLVFKHMDFFANKQNRIIYGPLKMYIDFEDNNGDDLVKILNEKTPDRKIPSDEIEALRSLSTGNLAQNMKKGFEAAGSNAKEQAQVFYMAFQFFKNEIEQRKLFCAAQEEFEKIEKEIYPLQVPGVADAKMLLIESDNPVMHKVAMSKWAAKRKDTLSVLFIRRTNGQFALIPQRNMPGLLAETKKIICETVAKNGNRGVIPFKEIGKFGDIEQVPEIYFDENMGIISNGSKTDPDVPGLIGNLISVEKIVRAVTNGVDEESFFPQFEKDCKAGMCVHGRCPLYVQYGSRKVP